MAIKTVRSEIIYPFLRATSALHNTVRLLGTPLVLDSSNSIGPLYEHLSPGEPFRLSFSACVDTKDIYDSCFGGNIAVPLDFVVLARCPTTRFERCLKVTEIPSADAQWTDQFEREIEPDDIARRVILVVRVLLHGDRKGPVSEARKSCSIVAEQFFDIVMEPDGREFPTSWISFKEWDLPAGLWHVQCDPSRFEMQDGPGIRILLNSDSHGLRRLLAESSARFPERRMARRLAVQLTASGCLSDLLQSILTSDEQPESDNSEDAWNMIFGTFSKIFEDWDADAPAASLGRVRKAFRDNPARLTTLLQERFGLEAKLSALF